MEFWGGKKVVTISIRMSARLKDIQILCGLGFHNTLFINFMMATSRHSEQPLTIRQYPDYLFL